MKTITGWGIKTLEECFDILDNKRRPINSEEREKRQGIIPYYGANGLQGFIDGFLFDEPLILIAEDGGQFSEFQTRPIAYRIYGKSWVNNHAHVLKAKKQFNQNAIFYALEHKDIQPYIVGGTRSKLNQSALRKIPILIPNDKAEQSKIAEILETVDRSIEQTEALIAKQQRIKTGLMQDLLTKGIDKHGNIRSEETHEFKNSPLGRIPVEWNVVELSNLANAIDPQPDHRTPAEVSDGIPYIGISDIDSDGYINFSRARKISREAFAKQQKAFKISNGDFIFGKIGTIGKPFKLPIDYNYALSANVILLKPFETHSFIYWWMASEMANNLVMLDLHTTSQPAFGMQKMRTFLIPKPSEDERKKIGKLFDEFEKDFMYEKRIHEKLMSIKTALMQDLLTGKKRVTPLLKETEVNQ